MDEKMNIQCQPVQWETFAGLEISLIKDGSPLHRYNDQAFAVEQAQPGDIIILANGQGGTSDAVKQGLQTGTRQVLTLVRPDSKSGQSVEFSVKLSRSGPTESIGGVFCNAPDGSVCLRVTAIRPGSLLDGHVKGGDRLMSVNGFTAADAILKEFATNSTLDMKFMRWGGEAPATTQVQVPTRPATAATSEMPPHQTSSTSTGGAATSLPAVQHVAEGLSHLQGSMSFFEQQLCEMLGTAQQQISAIDGGLSQFQSEKDVMNEALIDATIRVLAMAEQMPDDDSGA